MGMYGNGTNLTAGNTNGNPQIKFFAGILNVNKTSRKKQKEDYTQWFKSIAFFERNANFTAIWVAVRNARNLRHCDLPTSAAIQRRANCCS